MTNLTSSPIRASLSLWHLQGGELFVQPVDGPVSLTSDFGAATADAPNSPRLVPLSGDGDAVAAVVIPPRAVGEVVAGGVPLSCGLHLLRYTDQVDVAGQTYWVASTAEAEVVVYDAAVHGEDAYCFVTKARLQQGEEIVQCPGRPGVLCGVMYRRVAWEMAMESDPRFRCPNCRFDPSEGAWKPSLPEVSSLKLFLEKARRMHRGPSEA